MCFSYPLESAKVEKKEDQLTPFSGYDNLDVLHLRQNKGEILFKSIAHFLIQLHET